MSEVDQHNPYASPAAPEQPDQAAAQIEPPRLFRRRVIPTALLVLISLPCGAIGLRAMRLAILDLFTPDVRWYPYWPEYFLKGSASAIASLCGLLAAIACWKGRAALAAALTICLGMLYVVALRLAVQLF